MNIIRKNPFALPQKIAAFLALLCFAAALLITTGCNKDDDGPKQMTMTFQGNNISFTLAGEIDTE